MSRLFEGPNEYDWKGRALRAEAAMDFAARMVTYIMNGTPLTMESWPVEQYMKAIEDYRLFRYGRKEPMTTADIMAVIEKAEEKYGNGEGLAIAFDLGLCYDCGLPEHEGECITYDSVYPPRLRVEDLIIHS